MAQQQKKPEGEPRKDVSELLTAYVRAHRDFVQTRVMTYAGKQRDAANALLKASDELLARVADDQSADPVHKSEGGQ